MNARRLPPAEPIAPPVAAEPAMAAAAAEARRTLLLVLGLVAALVLALGLKVWEERQADDRALLTALSGDARTLAVQFDARIADIETRVALAPKDAAVKIDGVDSLLSFTEAAAAPPETRLGKAAVRAEILQKENARVGLTDERDLVILLTRDGAPHFAMIAAANWLPPQATHQLVSLQDSTLAFGAGDGAVSKAAGQNAFTEAGVQSAAGFSKTATACARFHGGELGICRTALRSQVGVHDLIRFLIFGLLLAAPLLVIFGLFNRMTKQEKIEIVREVRDEESDRILGLVMRGARAGYWEWTNAEQGIFFSEGASSLFGLEGTGHVDLAMLIGQIHPDHQNRVSEALGQARQTGWIQTTFPMGFLPERWIEIRGATSEGTSKADLVFGGIVLDITERKQQEERVKAAERRLRAAIEGFDGPFALWDHRRRLLYWNRAFAIDFNISDTLRPGMSHETVVVARAGAVRLEKQSSEDRRTTLIALQTGRWLKMVDRETREGGLITVGVDVTENVRNEEELKKQRERMKKAVMDLERSEGRASELSRKYSEEKTKAEHAANTKSAFLANMSHELRTPLNAINGFSEILANELYGPLGDQRYKGYASDILASGQHLLDMINDILDMAKIESGKMSINPQPLDPVDPVDAAVRMIRRKAEDKQIALILDAQPGLPDIEADHRAIRQMVLNLVSNAIKFTDAGGTITVRIEQRGPEIYVGVTDTGIGIPPEDLPRLAKPFEQVSGSQSRNTEGTGLGLALTKSFAEMHGGRMNLTSIFGEGTTVSFTLPIDGLDAAEADDDGLLERGAA